MSYSTTKSTATLRSKVAGPLLVYVFRRPVHCRALFPLWGRMAVLILHSLSTLYWDTSAPARKRRRRYITVYSVSLHTPVQRYPTSPWEVPPILGGGADLRFEVPKQFQIAPPHFHIPYKWVFWIFWQDFPPPGQACASQICVVMFKEMPTYNIDKLLLPCGRYYGFTLGLLTPSEWGVSEFSSSIIVLKGEAQ